MNESNEISSLYPPPPPFIKFFTEENVDKLRQVEKEGMILDAASSFLSDQEKDQLKYLVKPKLPESGTYRAFGNVWQIKDELPELSQLGIEQLYKKSHANGDDQAVQKGESYANNIHELKRLLKSLLLNFLELIGILGVNPNLYEKKLEEIRVITINIHHLLNEYRPHQSRESLIMLLEEQVEYKRKETEQIMLTCDEVESRLNGL